LETAVIPGEPIPHFVNSSVANRSLPSQWTNFQPAWDIAAAVLKNRSVVGAPGSTVGLEVAVEPWPLLETLLERSLSALETIYLDEGYKFEAKRSWPLLDRAGKRALQVEPDGLLTKHGEVVATFEAKYTRPGPAPAREHTFQAITTAAALGAPLAVIVYPGDEPFRRFDIRGSSEYPRDLVTMGLSMFSYLRPVGDESRARQLHQLLSSMSATTKER
jgi:hypothetical protein